MAGAADSGRVGGWAEGSAGAEGLGTAGAGQGGQGAMHEPVVGLERLEVGRRAAVVVMQEPHNPMMIRLKTMGLHEGRAVRMLRQGSRLIVECGGTRIGMAAEVAKLVLAQPLS